MHIIVNILMIAVLVFFVSDQVYCSGLEIDPKSSVSDVWGLVCYEQLLVDRNSVIPCVLNECSVAKDEMLTKLEFILSPEIMHEINTENILVLPGFCQGDDAVGCNIEISDYSIRIIDSRMLNIVIQPRRKSSSVPVNIHSVVTDALNTVLNINKDDYFLKDITHKPFINEEDSLNFLIQEKLHSYYWEDLLCWYSKDCVILNLVYFGKECSIKDRIIINQKVCDSDPVIKFPELRKKLGIVSQQRTEFKRLSPNLNMGLSIKSIGTLAPAESEYMRILHQTPKPNLMDLEK